MCTKHEILHFYMLWALDIGLEEHVFKLLYWNHIFWIPMWCTYERLYYVILWREMTCLLNNEIVMIKMKGLFYEMLHVNICIFRRELLHIHLFCKFTIESVRATFGSHRFNGRFVNLLYGNEQEMGKR